MNDLLAPALAAYGAGVVAVILAIIVLTLVTAVIDGIRVARRGRQRTAAMRRHPAGRHAYRPVDNTTTTQLPAVNHRPRPL